jgi:hypothetical protein
MGGIGAGPPPLASFFGVISLSLVLADFGTLLFSFFCRCLPAVSGCYDDAGLLGADVAKIHITS